MSVVETQNPAPIETRGSSVIRLRTVRATPAQWERVRILSDDYARGLAEIERGTTDASVRALREGADSAAELAVERCAAAREATG